MNSLREYDNDLTQPVMASPTPLQSSSLSIVSDTRRNWADIPVDETAQLPGMKIIRKKQDCY